MVGKILIVDKINNPTNNCIEFLENKGFGYRQTENSDELFKLLENKLFDVIFINIDMPDFDGISLLTKLKSHPVFYDIPIIILAEEINDSIIETCFSFGADDLIRIPTNEFLLQLRIKSTLEKQSFVTKIQTQRDELKMQKKIATENEDRVQKIMEAVQAGIILFNKKTGEVKNSNTHALHMTGYTKEEMLKFKHDELFEQNKNKRKTINDNKNETILICKNRKNIDILKNIAEIKIKGKSFTLESFVDISEQKNIQKKLQDQKKVLKEQRNEIEKQKNIAVLHSQELAINKQKLQTIIDTSLSGISLINLQGEFNFTNSVFYKMFNYTEAEFAKKTYFNLLPPAEVDEAMQNHNMLMSGQLKFIERIRKYVKKDGTYFWGHISASPIPGSNGEPEGIVSFLTDIDILKRSELEIKKNNRNINAALTYAKRIQSSLLPSEEFLNKIFPENFILYRPKDVVSGDFYWAKQVDEFLLIAAADCTGHGIPGAFMSLLFISILNKVTYKKNLSSAGAILDQVKKELSMAFSRGDSKPIIQDGMDIALCLINTEANTCNFAGAYNPLYFFRNGSLTEIKGSSMPIGLWRKEQSFVNHEFKITKDDIFYIFSDGFYDQIGGGDSKKFMKGKFRKLLTEINTMPLTQQESYLNGVLDKWQGKLEQVDDILVIGFKIPVNKDYNK